MVLWVLRRTTFGNFFLTSKPYFGLDDDNFLQAEFDITEGRLSYQPSDYGYITAYGSFQYINVYGGGVTYNIPAESIAAYGEFSQVDVYGGGVVYTPDPEAIRGTARFTNIDIYVVAVSNVVELHSITATGSLQSIDIT